MDTRNLQGKTAMVTGAASGIGQATALLLAQRGADLFLCDVNEAELTETAQQAEKLGRNVFARRVDVADRDAMRAFANEVHEQVTAVDLLMNNAGVGLGARFCDTSLEDWDWIVGINLMGVVHGCHFFVPQMIESGPGGHVINVSSAAAFVSPQSLHAYATTKHAVLGQSEALREELAPFGIGVTAVCPGVINTPIVHSSQLRGVYAQPGARTLMISRYEKRNFSPERVAEAILKAVHKNRGVAPVTLEAWTLHLLKRLSPRFTGWLAQRIAAQQERELAARSR